MPSSMSSPASGLHGLPVTHDVDGVHVSGFVVEIVRLGVAEVKAALAVEIEGGGDHVDAFGLPVDGSACRGVVAVAGARGDGDAVDLVSADGCRESVGHGGDVVAVRAGTACCATRRRGREVVVVGRLVVELGDCAGSVGAEGVLRGGIGVAIGKEADIGVVLSDCRVT